MRRPSKPVWLIIARRDDMKKWILWDYRVWTSKKDAAARFARKPKSDPWEFDVVKYIPVQKEDPK